MAWAPGNPANWIEGNLDFNGGNTSNRDLDLRTRICSGASEMENPAVWRGWVRRRTRGLIPTPPAAHGGQSRQPEQQRGGWLGDDRDKGTAPPSRRRREPHRPGAWRSRGLGFGQERRVEERRAEARSVIVSGHGASPISSASPCAP